MTGTPIQAQGPPPERYADRIVGVMLRQIAETHQHRMEAINKVCSETRDGNPRAQQKMIDRIKQAGAPFILTAKLDPGKRGRYRFALISLDGYDPARKTLILPGDPIPEKPWLACSRVVIKSLGRGEYDQQIGIMLVVTHHALSRAVQRCGGRTHHDLLCVANNIWGAYVDEFEPGRFDFRDGHRLRFALTATEHAYAVLNHYDDGQGGVVVATIVDQP